MHFEVMQLHECTHAVIDQCMRALIPCPYLCEQVSMAGLFFTPFLRDGDVFPAVNIAAVAGLADLARKVSEVACDDVQLMQAHACSRH